MSSTAFKIGDLVKLESSQTEGVYDAFKHRGITTEHLLKVVIVSNTGGLGFEGGWEKESFYPHFFELVSNRKERINNLYKEI